MLRSLVAATALAIGTVRMALAQTTGTFNREPWIADYATLKLALERDYSHLAWFASPQGGVDLPALDRATLEALARASSDREASAAIFAFVAGIHDGHLAARPPRAAAAPTTPEPAVAPGVDAKAACAGFGFAAVTRVSFTLPFEALPGFELLADGNPEAFRAGVVEREGRRIGIVRIPRFRAREYPELCERIWNRLRARQLEPSRSAVTELADEEWLRVLAERLLQLAARHPDALVVDVGGDGGGNDLGDWAVRLFTKAPVRSAPMLMSESPVAIPYFEEQLGDIGRVLDSTRDLAPATRRALEAAQGVFEHFKVRAQGKACDMSWVWREQREWGAAPCNRLIASGSASGALDFAPPGSLEVSAARVLYWASRADSVRGAWDGPTYILTDGGTGSAAEMFTALIRDRGIAKTVGSRTFGLGCGFVDAGDPLVLPNSRITVSIPNCVRLRADGSDEVAGVAPDLPLTRTPAEAPAAAAERALHALGEDLRSRRPQ